MDARRTPVALFLFSYFHFRSESGCVACICVCMYAFLALERTDFMQLLLLTLDRVAEIITQAFYCCFI